MPFNELVMMPSELKRLKKNIRKSRERVTLNLDRDNNESSRRLNPAKWLEEHGDYLFNFAFARLRDRENAEEVVQETLVSGIKSAHQYSGKGAERAWLTGILKRKIIDSIRERSRRRAVGTGGDDQNDLGEQLFDRFGAWKSRKKFFGTSPDSNLLAREFWRDLNDCIAGLPPKQADVFALRELDEKTTDEICSELDVTTANLWVLLHRARLRLAICLKSKWGIAE